MAAHIYDNGRQSWAAPAWDEAGAPAGTAYEGALDPGRAGAALGVAAAAILLGAAPAVVAVIAMVSPGELERAFGWLAGGTLAFSLVAAGRVPAAALLAVALAGRRFKS